MAQLLSGENIQHSTTNIEHPMDGTAKGIYERKKKAPDGIVRGFDG
jgi:hypothetical protein